MRKYKLNENIFETIDSEEKAYWLGFILADGSIYTSPSGQTTLKISLAGKDKNHLEKFRLFLETNKPIGEYTVGNGLNDKRSACCEISVTSKKIASDLMKFGVGPKKSFTVQIPSIEDSLERHLIRGIWDGDGSVLFRAANKNYPDNLQPEVQICGNYAVVEYINNYFLSKLNLKKAKLTKTASIYLFRKSGRPAQKVIKKLYQNSSIFLTRKMEKATLGLNWKTRRPNYPMISEV